MEIGCSFERNYKDSTNEKRLKGLPYPSQSNGWTHPTMAITMTLSS